MSVRCGTYPGDHELLEDIMQNAWHLKATVQAGGRIDVTDAALPSGASVDIFVLSSLPRRVHRRSALDILADAPGQRGFKTAEEVDDYIRSERDSWDR